MKVTVILTTYNSPDWLEKVLWGYEAQRHRDFEVIIADDGSGAETSALIERMRSVTRLEIRHVWQEDDGFRKSRILNKAILHATADYVLFSDGDCIPRNDFVETHSNRAKPGCYLSGGNFKLPMETSRAITAEDIRAARCFDKHWLRGRGLPQTASTSKLSSSPRVAALLNRLTPTRCNFKGSNGSAWLSDILDVNGFNERMPYGGLDREFGVRLINRGIRPIHVRYDAVCLHLEHSKAYRNEDQVNANRKLRKASERNRIQRTEFGIRQLLDSGYFTGKGCD